MKWLFAWFALTTFSLADDSVIISSSTSIDANNDNKRTRIQYSITRETLFSIPSWDADSEPIPLPLEKALKIARAYLRETSDFKPRLWSCTLNTVSSRWYYRFEFETNKGQGGTVIVLFNGMIVEPTTSVTLRSK